MAINWNWNREQFKAPDNKLLNSSLEKLFGAAGDVKSSYRLDRALETLRSQQQNGMQTPQPTGMLDRALNSLFGKKEQEVPQSGRKIQKWFEDQAVKKEVNSIANSPYLSPRQKEMILAKVVTKNGKSAWVNEATQAQFQKQINDLESVGYVINSLGGYADRANVNNPKRKSQHAYGYAIDINPATNPNGTRQTDMPIEQTYQFAKNNGVGWGHGWKSIGDPMHFSAAEREGGRIFSPEEREAFIKEHGLQLSDERRRIALASSPDLPISPQGASYQTSGLPGVSQQPMNPERQSALYDIMRSDTASPELRRYAMSQLGTGSQFDFVRTDQGMMRVNPQTGQAEIVPGTAPEMKMPNSFQEYQLAQQNPEYGQFMMDRSKASGTNVNVGGPQGKYGETIDKADAEDFLNIRKSATAAMATNQTLDVMSSLIDDKNVYQGTGGEYVNKLKTAAKSLGFEVEGVTGEQVLKALGNRIALELRNPAGGAGMPGALSDKDREFLVSMVPGLTNTPEGNKMLIEYMKRMNNRSMQIHKMADEYVRANGGRFDSGFYTQLAQWSAQNPLFTQDDYARIQGIGQQQQTLPQAQTTQQSPATSYKHLWE